MQLKGQNFDFNAHSCTWIKNSLSTSKMSAGCVIGAISGLRNHPPKINTIIITEIIV